MSNALPNGASARGAASTEEVMSSEALLQRVCELVRQVTAARFEGGAYAKLARAHGYADGYMRALIDAGLAERGELIRAVGQARRDALEGKGSGTREAA